MKINKLVAFAILLIGLVYNVTSAYSQTVTIDSIPVVDGKLMYSETKELPNVTKAELYKRAKQWLVDTFVDYKAVIETEDQGFEHLSAKGIVRIKFHTLGIGNPMNDRFTMRFDFKDGKYRCNFYDFRVQEAMSVLSNPTSYSMDNMYQKITGNGSSPYSKRLCKEMLFENHVQMKKLISLFNQAMASKSISDF